VIDPIVEQMDKLVDLKWKNSQKLIDDAQKATTCPSCSWYSWDRQPGAGNRIILIVASGQP